MFCVQLPANLGNGGDDDDEAGGDDGDDNVQVIYMKFLNVNLGIQKLLDVLAHVSEISNFHKTSANS